eukprot:2179682-Rhodomonas_salina.1
MASAWCIRTVRNQTKKAELMVQSALTPRLLAFDFALRFCTSASVLNGCGFLYYACTYPPITSVSSRP